MFSLYYSVLLCSTGGCSEDIPHDPVHVSLDPGVHRVLGRVVGLVQSWPSLGKEGSALLLKPEDKVRSGQVSVDVRVTWI